MKIEGIEIAGVTSDSRRVKNGYAFVAIKGQEVDGNNFVKDVIKNGAVVIFTEENLELEEVKVIQVEDARKKLAELCNEFYQYPSEKLKIVGVTGTNGKTTTSNLIYEVLRENGISAGLIGTLNIKVNDKVYETNLTTPIAEDIYRYLALMVEEKVEVVVMEVSSHGLKSQRVHKIKFDIAIHTNIEKDHLNYHKTFEDYLQSKKKLFSELDSGKMAIINFDDMSSLRLLEGNQHITVITYGLNKRCTITASSIDFDKNITFTYCMQRGATTLSGVEIDPFEFPIQLNLLGDHNVYNSLAAITCCLLLDVPITGIAKTLKKFKSLSRRMEIIYQGDFTVIDDFCHNPASYQAVLESVQRMQYRNLYIVNGIRGNRGIEVNRDNAEVLKQWAEILRVKELYITACKDYASRNDTVTEAERDIYLDIFKNSEISYQFEERLTEALTKMIKQLKYNDLVLLLGSQVMDKGKKLFLQMIRETLGLNIDGFSEVQTEKHVH
ncbi:Mur ligase family protein [Alkaliphilus transvaalensis]|uniref:Mur ligase family protein n=1 Tax=Alkaliphilus transvaalensis TaxID=114628 RepID=UPI0006877A37|nr:UDP-N-acetylmuramoyl-L-alanyl-D-glutamate--2,6-diaminopimelate ligase [Alkaliphilus transvaalensis]